MKLVNLQILVLVLILGTTAWAKLPPNVTAIFPADKTAINVKSEFWLYGPTLGSYAPEKISLKDGEGKTVEFDLKVYPANDYTDFEFDGDFRDVSGDSGELELLIIKPKSALESEQDYVLSSGTLETTYRTSEASSTVSPSVPNLLSAKLSRPRGHHFDGERLYSTAIAFTLPEPSFTGRLEILDAKSGELLAFALSAAFAYNNDHLEVTTRVPSKRLKVRLVDYLGQASETSPEVVVNTGARSRSYLVRIAVLALFGMVIFKLVSSRSNVKAP